MKEEFETMKCSGCGNYHEVPLVHNNTMYICSDCIDSFLFGGIMSIEHITFTPSVIESCKLCDTVLGQHNTHSDPHVCDSCFD